MRSCFHGDHSELSVCFSFFLSFFICSLSLSPSPVSQAYVQCREDDGEREVQTDLIELLDKWTQHPADHTGACGGKTGGRPERQAERQTGVSPCLMTLSF